MAQLDSRIGRRAPNGKIVRGPSFYVTGETYVAGANPAPTMYWIDQAQEYFVLLPVSLSHISDIRHLELLMAIGKPEEYQVFYGRVPPTEASDDEFQEELVDPTPVVQASVASKTRKVIVIGGNVDPTGG